MTSDDAFHRAFEEAAEIAAQHGQQLQLSDSLSAAASLGAKVAFFYSGFLSTQDHLGVHFVNQATARDAMALYIQTQVWTQNAGHTDPQA